jgi:hypothetical protein
LYYEQPNLQLPGSDVNPGFGARDRSLEILRQSTVSIEPSKGSFDDPSAWQQLKADGVSGGFDDFDGPFRSTSCASLIARHNHRATTD